MKLLNYALFGMGLWLTAAIPVQSAPPHVVRHVPVYDVDGRFGGWPANHGMWQWGTELLCGFSAGYYQDLGPERHAIDRDRPEEHLLARSRDGGETWSIENPAAQGVLLGNREMRHGTVPPGYHEAAPIECPEPVQFNHPDFAMTLRMSSVHTGVSRWYVSYDRGHTWRGPFRLPLMDQSGISARTDYIVDGERSCTVFLTASKSNQREGRVICARTEDGGMRWSLVGYVGPEPQGYAIMPSSVRLGPAELLCTRRVKSGEGEPLRSWIDAFRSTDNGKTWTFENEPVPDTGEGNPPSLIRLADGRLVLTYGVRKIPYGMYAKWSRDGGRTWSEPFALREDGAGRDIGYPRSSVRPDGKVVTLYYIHDSSDVDRKIMATIWDPGD